MGDIINCGLGQFRNLVAFQKAECVYDITFYFVERYLNPHDRTCDQMIQAARSGKQNIVEGAAAQITSRETELKLTNVARASLQELLVDYEDYLRVRGMTQWNINSDKARQARRVCGNHNDSEYYREAIKLRSDETIANIAITLIHQSDVLLRRLIESIEERFLEEGGVRERLAAARRKKRGY